MKKTTYLAFSLLLATMAGCKKNVITQIGDPATGAQIKLIHAAAGVPGIDAYINNNKITPVTTSSVTDNAVLTSITTGYVYGGVFPGSNYAVVQPGATTIKITASTPVPALQSPQTVAPGATIGTVTQNTVNGGAYSVFTMGLPGSATNGLTVKVVEDKFPAAADGKAYVRLANMIPNGPVTNVDLKGTYTPTGATTATTTTVITNIAYGTVTDFTPISVNSSGSTGYYFQLYSAGTSTTLGGSLGTAAKPIALAPGRYYTLVAYGLGANYAVPGTSITLRSTARPTTPIGDATTKLPEIYFNPPGLFYYTTK